MKGEGIEKELIEKIKEISKEASNVVRGVDGVSKEFRTRKGLRQGCELSLILFNLYIAGLEKELEDNVIGRVKIGGKRI